MANIPLAYRLFFLYVEPISTLVGAYYAWFQPLYYLTLLHTPSAPGSSLISPSSIPLGTEIILRHLSNLYFAFTLNEALVLRATSDLKVWRTLLLGLLIADIGHLYSCAPLGVSYYYDVWKWNTIDWGNVAFVYVGATLRTCFLFGLGLGTGEKVKARRQRAVKTTSDRVSDTAGFTDKETPTPERRRGRKPKSKA